MDTIDEFKIPEDLYDYLKKYHTFKNKKYFSTMENKFYVGTPLHFIGIDSKKCGSYDYSIKKYVRGNVDHIKLKEKGTCCKEIHVVYETLEKFKKHFKPVKYKEKKYLFKFKIFGKVIKIENGR